jgi:hypothetical protein
LSPEDIVLIPISENNFLDPSSSRILLINSDRKRSENVYSAQASSKSLSRRGEKKESPLNMGGSKNNDTGS